MKNILIILFLINTFVLLGQDNVEIESNIIKKKLASQYFENDRTIKIYLPKNHDNNKKHSVIYTLDGYELFPITSNYVSFLVKYDIIPNSIVVSVYHNDRNYETTPNYGQDAEVPLIKYLKGSEKLKNHLLNEVKPLIEKEYATSDFNVLVGHSNTATFVNELISKNDNPFKGFIAISPDLAEEQISHLKKYLSEKRVKKIYYFVSSGLKDDKYRLETGQRIDTIFQTTDNNNLMGLHKTYKAGHLDLVPKSLNEALMFVFSDYRNYDDFEEKMSEIDFSVKNYISKKIQESNNTFGIASSLNEEDYYYLIEKIANKKNRLLLDQILEVGYANKFYTENHLYSDRAQWYEQAEFYEVALINWILQLENGYYENTFYFERPFKLLTEKLKRPKQGIQFLEKSIKKYPKGGLIFKYWIARTILENNLKKKDGIKAINYCIDNFKENRKFSLVDAKDLKMKFLIKTKIKKD